MLQTQINDSQRKVIYTGKIGAALLAACIYFLATPTVAVAYVGPGAGITMLGALWGIVIAILFALAGLFIWPLRALLRRRKLAESSSDTAELEAKDTAEVEADRTSKGR